MQISEPSSPAQLPASAAPASDGELIVLVRVILRQFYRPEPVTRIEEETELALWVECLQPATVAEVFDAWRTYQADGPRTDRGILIRPDAGALRKLIMAARAPIYAQRARQIAQEADEERYRLRKPATLAERLEVVARVFGRASDVEA